MYLLYTALHTLQIILTSDIFIIILVKTATELEWGVELAELYDIPVLSSVQDTKKPC
jgi:hypothetical protein